MKAVHVRDIINRVALLCREANLYLPRDVLRALKKAREKEESFYGRAVLDQILENAEIAARDKIPLCQDCGATVVFAEIGQDVRITGGRFDEAIEQGIRKGYKESYLRKSMCHPFTRKNTGDNTPVILHTEIVSGDKLTIVVCPKGGGSENTSALKMLSPSQGLEGVKKFVLETIEKAGANPCPPIIVGVGIGGNFEKSALLAKKALLRPLNSRNIDPELAALEDELLEKINDLGIGPAGYGGKTTALAVHIEMFACHIASLPVAVNINCHAARHQAIKKILRRANAD